MSQQHAPARIAIAMRPHARRMRLKKRAFIVISLDVIETDADFGCRGCRGVSLDIPFVSECDEEYESDNEKNYRQYDEVHDEMHHQVDRFSYEV